MAATKKALDNLKNTKQSSKSNQPKTTPKSTVKQRNNSKSKGKPRGGSFKKGQSGNPNGRPKKGTALTDILSLNLDKADKSGKLLREAIAEKLIDAALNGDIIALKYVFDRLDGKPKESVELSGIETSKVHIYLPDNDRSDKKIDDK